MATHEYYYSASINNSRTGSAWVNNGNENTQGVYTLSGSFDYEVAFYISADTRPAGNPDGWYIDMILVKSNGRSEYLTCTASNVIKGNATYSLGKKYDFLSGGVMQSYDYDGNPLDHITKQTIISTNIKVFDTKDHAKNYLTTGDETGIVSLPIYIPINWKIYVNGNKSPYFKITWDANTENVNNIEILNSSYVELYCSLGEYSVTDQTSWKLYATIPFTNGNYDTSFNSLMTKVNKDWLSNIIGSLFPNSTVNNINIILRAVFNSTDKSSFMYAQCGYDGHVDKYGYIYTGNTDGSTIDIVYGTGIDNEGYITPNNNSDTAETIIDTPINGYSANGILTATYAITENVLQNLGSFLWGNSFIENIKLLNNSPIENILSIKLMPINLISGEESSILLGNVDSGLRGSKVTSKVVKVVVGSLAINESYNSFLDYAPYTKITIFLPFIGFKELDCNEFMGRNLTVTYYFDIITGTCQADLSSNGYSLAQFDGMCGIDIPITASNRAMVESSFITGIIGTGASLATGNVGGVIGSLANSAKIQYHYQTEGCISPSCSSQNMKNCYVIIDRPTYQDIETFRKTKGLMCNLSYAIGSLSGFTKCAEGVNLSGISCTENERKEIHDILTSGFFA